MATAVEMPVFVKKHELSGLLKDLKATTKESLAYIEQMMKDEKETTKVRLDCAKYLVDTAVSLSDMISKDEITRNVAEIKAEGLSRPLGYEGGGKALPPVLDMDTIQEV